MKAAVFRGAGENLRIEELEQPTAEPGMLVFRVKACGICGSDLHAAQAPGMLPDGIVLGHEYSGEVVAIGAGVSGWSEGDRLIAVPGKPCGECASCRDGGDMASCMQIVIQGFDPRMQGAYAEYASCLADLALKLPSGVSDIDAALIEPLAVGLGAWKRVQPAAAANVLIIGAGIIGLSVAKWAKFFGAANVVVSELVPARQARAQQLGVDLVIDAGSDPDPVAEYQRALGCKPTLMFECTGSPIINALIEIAPMDAELVLVGTGMQEESFTVLAAAMKRLQMTFHLGYEPADFEFILQLLAAGRMGVEDLVTGSVTLEQVPDMFALLGAPNEHCKVMITPNQ